MGLDETRIGQPFFQRAEDRIETFDVADLENESRAPPFRQFAGVRRIVGDRFFHEQMFALLQQFAADLEVGVRWRGDRRGVDLAGKFFEGRRGLDPEFRGPLLRYRAIGIVNGGELRARQLRVEPRVILSDVADADHANARALHVWFSRNHW